MILAFDTETTGLPDYRAPPDATHQPHLVQLAMILLDDDMVERASVSVIIKPDGWTIPDRASDVHGITTEAATKFGIPEKVAVRMFISMTYDLDAKVVAHNRQFDLFLMRSAMMRAGLSAEQIDGKKQESYCTMEAATPIVNLPPTAKMLAAGFNKPKSASLSECIRFFFDETLEGAHDALVDVRACVRVYRHLMTPQEAI